MKKPHTTTGENIQAQQIQPTANSIIQRRLGKKTIEERLLIIYSSNHQEKN